MPELPATYFGLTPQGLYDRGRHRVELFCRRNNIVAPNFLCIPKKDWHVGACAFYRPCSIHICLEYCGRPCGDAPSRNWTWPGSTTDREPYGVIAHELGHHVDWISSERKGTYGGDCSTSMRENSGEKPLTSYCDNDWEWFAEMFRLFVTNHALLERVRPRTWELFSARWTPVSGNDWVKELGANVPARVVAAARKKIVRVP